MEIPKLINPTAKNPAPIPTFSASTLSRAEGRGSAVQNPQPRLPHLPSLKTQNSNLISIVSTIPRGTRQVECCASAQLRELLTVQSP